MIMPPISLCDGSSGYAMGHPVMSPDRGWASARNTYTGKKDVIHCYISELGAVILFLFSYAVMLQHFLLNIYLKNVDEDIFLKVTVLIRTYTCFNVLISGSRYVHSEPWRRFTIAAVGTFTIITIPKWVISSQNYWDGSRTRWITGFTVLAISHKRRRRCSWSA